MVDLQARIAATIERRNGATSRVMQAIATEAQAYMQAHAAWKDRTGDARRSLQATADLSRVGGGRERHSEWDLVLSYGVPYGKWLETIHGPAMGHRAGMSDAELLERGNAGNLAILWPTLNVFAPRLRRAVRAARDAA